MPTLNKEDLRLRGGSIPKKLIAKEGVEIVASEGNALTRVHLDLAPDSLTLSTAGAASAILQKDNRHRIVLSQTKEGITLSIVGAANSALRK